LFLETSLFLNERVPRIDHESATGLCFQLGIVSPKIDSKTSWAAATQTLMDQDREITREEIHKLVWSKPTSKVAKEFGLSDVGLAEICPKLGVGKPPRGELGEKSRVVYASASRCSMRYRENAF
jgi:hypothetical protein